MSAAAVHACLEHWLTRQSKGEIPLEFSHFVTYDGQLMVANPLAAAGVASSPAKKAPRKHRRGGKKKALEDFSPDNSEEEEIPLPDINKKRYRKRQQAERSIPGSAGSSSSPRFKKRPRQSKQLSEESTDDELPQPRPDLEANTGNPQPTTLSQKRSPLFLQSDSEEEFSMLDREQRRYDKAPREPSPYEEHVDTFDYGSLDPQLLAISKAMIISRAEVAVATATKPGDSSSQPSVQKEPALLEPAPMPVNTSPSEGDPTGPILESEVPMLLAKYPESTRAKASKLGFTNALIANNPVLLSMVHNIVLATPVTGSVTKNPTSVEEDNCLGVRGRTSRQKDIGSPVVLHGTAHTDTAVELETARAQLAAAAAQIEKLTLTVASQQEPHTAIEKVLVIPSIPVDDVAESDVPLPKKRSISKTAKIVAAREEEQEKAAAKLEREKKKAERAKKKEELLKVATAQVPPRPRPRPKGRVKT